MILGYIFFAGVITGITGAMIPGPLTLFTVAEVLKTNRTAGLKTITGHILIEFILICLLFLGFRALFENAEFLKITSIIGGIALILMGVLLVLRSGKMEFTKEPGEARFEKGLILGGVFFSITSPGFLVWWLTIGFSTITKASLFGMTGIVMLVLGHWLADIIWYSLLSYAVEKGKMFLSPVSYHNILRIFAALLIILGISFLIFKGF